MARALERRIDEPSDRHQALLLYALAGRGRTPGQVARALLEADSTMRTWRRRWEWDERIAATEAGNETPDVEAYLLWQREYLPLTAPIRRMREELRHTDGFMADLTPEAMDRDEAESRSSRARADGRGPMHGNTVSDPATSGKPAAKRGRPPGPMPFTVARLAGNSAGATAGVADRPPRAPPDRPPGLDPRAPPRLAKPDDVLQKAARNAVASALAESVRAAAATPGAAPPLAGTTSATAIHREEMLVDAALGYAAKQLSEGKVRVTMEGIGRMVQLRRLLRGEATARLEVGPTHAAIQTTRLRQAGDDARARLTAMREDIADIAAILAGIEASEDQEPINAGDVVDGEAEVLDDLGLEQQEQIA